MCYLCRWARRARLKRGELVGHATFRPDTLRKRYGKTYEFHTYENAGHEFFAVDRPNYRQAAAVDGWDKVFAFYGKHLR